MIAGFWTAIWPNLAASAIWAPLAFGANHLLVRRHIDRRHQEHMEHVTNLIKEST